MTLPPALLDSLSAAFHADALALGEAERIAYSYDNSRLHALPDAVVFPTEHAQVEALVQACRELRRRALDVSPALGFVAELGEATPAAVLALRDRCRIRRLRHGAGGRWCGGELRTDESHPAHRS